MGGCCAPLSSVAVVMPASSFKFYSRSTSQHGQWHDTERLSQSSAQGSSDSRSESARRRWRFAIMQVCAQNRSARAQRCGHPVVLQSCVGSTANGNSCARESGNKQRFGANASRRAKQNSSRRMKTREGRVIRTHFIKRYKRIRMMHRALAGIEDDNEDRNLPSRPSTAKADVEDEKHSLFQKARRQYAYHHGCDPFTLTPRRISDSCAGLEGWAEAGLFSSKVVTLYVEPSNACQLHCTNMAGEIAASVMATRSQTVEEFAKSLAPLLDVSTEVLCLALPDASVIDVFKYATTPILDLVLGPGHVGHAQTASSQTVSL